MNRFAVSFFVGAAAVSSAFAGDVVKLVKADFADYGSRSFVHYAVPAMSEVQRLPDVYPTDGKADAPVKIFAAKGEYEPGSFEVWGVRDLGKVSFELGEFKNEKGAVFPKENLDLKLVKCWYQNLNAWFSYFADTGDFKLVPELLLNDEGLIRTDAKTKSNYARRTDANGKTHEQWINPPRYMDWVPSSFNSGSFSAFKPMAPGFQDAATLQPVRIVKDEFRNFFLTVKTTKDTPAGVYRGEIGLFKGQKTGDGRLEALGAIPVEIHVADYELPRPKCYLDPERDFYVSMMHYERFEHILSWNGGDRELAKRQLAAILRDEVAHGQDIHCGSYANAETLFTLDESLKAGMRPDVFAVCFLPWGKDSEARKANGRRLSAAMDRRYGHRNLYVGYGDEPALGDDGVGGFFHDYVQFLKEYEPFGWKFSLSGDVCCYRKLGYGLQLFNMAASPTEVNDPNIRMWSRQPGVRRAWYANQHVGAENPALARRQNGLAPWLAGYDTLNNYAQHLGPYNDDCEDGLYRPMVYAYGTYNGVIDTIAWEGFREGVDDMRYATLLSDLAYKALKHGDVEVQHLGRKVFQYLSLLDRTSCDLDTVRAEMRRYIDRLLANVKPDPVRPIAVPEKKPAESDRLFAAESDPLEAELAKKDPNTYGATLKKLKAVYAAHMRYDELVDRLERLGEPLEAAAAAETALQYDRADGIRLAALRDGRIKDPGARAAAAWALVGPHPEIFDDPALKPCLEPYNAKTNSYLSRIWGRWGTLNDDTLLSARRREGWKRAYRLAVQVADAGGLSAHDLVPGAVDRGLRIFAAEHDWKSVKELATRYLGKKGLQPKEQYFYRLVCEVLCADAKEPLAGRLAAFAAATAKDIPFGVRKAAINKAGVLGTEACDEKLVRGLRDYLAALYRPEPKLRYVVKFVDRDISGVSDWRDIEAEEAHYDRKFGSPTELMSTDVTTGGRNVTDTDRGKYAASMRLVANRWGLHFLFTSKTDKAREIEAHRAFAGNFEAYLAPGKNKPYVCLMTDDGEGRWRIFNTAYDAIGQQSIDAKDPDRVRCSSAVTDDGFQTQLSLSWENFVNDLPRDGTVWDFENLRWGSGGGSWNGLKTIHGRSSWGELVFSLAPEERAKIVRRVADGAYFRFKRECVKTQRIDRYEGCARHWRDPYVGDPAFYEAKVKPWAEPLLETGKVLAEQPSDKTILRLEENGTISQWHNVFFVLDRMRYDWLTK